MRKALLTLAAAAAMAAPPALGADKVKVGVILTLSGPAGIIGKHMKDAFELGLEHIGGKLGGLETEIIYADDRLKPDDARQIADEMIEREGVQFITGIIWSEMLMTIHRPVTRSGTFLISANAGPSQAAGERCHENFFAVSWQDDQTPEAMGKYLQDNNINDLYLMAPDYQAGRDMLSGLLRTYKGKVADQVYVQLGQKDYRAELSRLRAAEPEAVFVFMPGGMGINFVRQYDQAGLREAIPLYTVFTADGVTLTAQKEAALGLLGTQSWSPDLNNAVNKRFVKDFRAKYGYAPSFYGAQAYDTVMFLETAIRKVGNVSDKDALRAAMRRGGFPNTRGSIKFNHNHFPIQNFYVRKIVKDANGDYTPRIQGIALSAYGDSYAEDCEMKW